MLANLALLRENTLLMPASAHVGRQFAQEGRVALLPLSTSSAGALGMYWRDSTDTDPAIAEMIQCLRDAARIIADEHNESRFIGPWPIPKRQ